MLGFMFFFIYIYTYANGKLNIYNKNGKEKYKFNKVGKNQMHTFRLGMSEQHMEAIDFGFKKKYI